MNTTLLQHDTAHPPDTEDRKILTVPDHDDLQRLALADRLTVRLGLWLLNRSLTTNDQTDRALTRTSGTGLQDPQRQALNEHEAITLLVFGLHQRSLL